MTSESQAILDRLADILAEAPERSERVMMGCLALFLRGHMVAAVDLSPARAGRVMFRVGPARRAEALALPGTAPVRQGARTMTGFVALERADADLDGATFSRLAEMALDTVAALPEK